MTDTTTIPPRPTGLRARKKAATAEALADAARDKILAGDDWATEDLTRAADVSARTFFRYYPTKADVIFAACGIPAAPPFHTIMDDVDRPLLRRAVATDFSLVGVLITKLAENDPRTLTAAAQLVQNLLTTDGAS